MKTEVFKSELEKSFLNNDLTRDLKQKIELFLANSNLSLGQKTDIVKLLEETYNEGFTGSIYIDLE
jgi:hypothetical protein